MGVEPITFDLQSNYNNNFAVCVFQKDKGEYPLQRLDQEINQPISL